MQQVDKKTINYLIILVVSVFFIFGCSSKNEYTSTTKSFDQNITKDQLLDAAKRVFILSGEDAFIIDSYRSELNVTKPKAVYKFFTMDMRNDNFNFEINEDRINTTLRATLSISRSYGIEEENRDYVDENSTTYTLFWDRVEYLLGLKKDWTKCEDPTWEDFFCDRIELVDTAATSKDLIDLNTTQSDLNDTVELITIDTSRYTKSQSKEDDTKEYYVSSQTNETKNKDLVGSENNNSSINLEPVDRNSTLQIDTREMILEDINSSKR